MKTLIFFFVCLFSAMQLIAQENEENRGLAKDRMFIGGNLGFGLGSQVSSVNITPQVGYYFTDWFAAGAGLNAIFRSYKEKSFGDEVIYKENYGVAGLNFFARVFPVDFLFIEIQPEANQVWIKQKNYDPPLERKLSKTVPSLLGGAGVIIPSGKGGLMIKMQYDLLQHDFNPYGKKAFFAFGYVVGL